jgi:hypothetical protein
MYKVEKRVCGVFISAQGWNQDLMSEAAHFWAQLSMLRNYTLKQNKHELSLKIDICPRNVALK